MAMKKLLLLLKPFAVSPQPSHTHPQVILVLLLLLSLMVLSVLLNLLSVNGWFVFFFEISYLHVSCLIKCLCGCVRDCALLESKWACGKSQD